MNDYKELLKALRSCQHIASNCIDCPLSNTKHYNPKTHECEVHLHNKAADAIEQLVKERDAAVESIKQCWLCASCKKRIRGNEWVRCKHFEAEVLVVKSDESYTCKNWEWRGVQE